MKGGFEGKSYKPVADLPISGCLMWRGGNLEQKGGRCGGARLREREGGTG